VPLARRGSGDVRSFSEKSGNLEMSRTVIKVRTIYTPASAAFVVVGIFGDWSHQLAKLQLMSVSRAVQEKLIVLDY